MSRTQIYAAFTLQRERVTSDILPLVRIDLRTLDHGGHIQRTSRSRIDNVSPLDLFIYRTHSLWHFIDVESNNLQSGSQGKQRSEELLAIERDERECRKGRGVPILDARFAILFFAPPFPPTQ